MPFSFRFVLTTLLISFCVCGVRAQSSKVQEEFHRYMISLDLLPTEDLSLERVQGYIAAGADPHAIAVTGGNAFNLASDAYAYDSGELDRAKILADITYYIASLGVDTNVRGERGFIPLFVLLNWGTSNEMFNKMLEFQLSRPIDLNRRSEEGRGLAPLFSGGRYRDLAEKLIRERGFRMDFVNLDGLSFTHSAAKRKPTDGRPLLLKYFLDLFTAEEAKYYASLPGNDGSTPLHFAAHASNLEAIKYLVSEQGVDVNAKTQEGETPLAIAIKNKNQEIRDYLISKGATATQEETTDCGPLTGDLTYEILRSLIERCQVKSIDQLLPLLPAYTRSNYFWAYGTLAVQEASPDFPQIVSFGRTGKLLLAFNGHKSQVGYRNLEIIQFRDDSKTFEFRDIKFPYKSTGEVKFSEANPSKCLACHGARPRPLWDNWTLWPGKFRGEMDTATPREKEFLARFMKNRHTGRYKHLLSQSLSSRETSYGPSLDDSFQLIKMDGIMADLVPQKVAREIKETEVLKPFRYALLAAVSCSEEITEFIPKKVLGQFKMNLESLAQDTHVKSRQELISRIKLQETFLGTEVTGRYVVQNKYLPRSGRNFEVPRTTKLRFIAENNYVETADWFTAFNGGKPSFIGLSFEGLENTLWTEVLNPDADAGLHAEFKAAALAAPQTGLPSRLFFGTKAKEEKVCPKLKEASLAELSKL